MDDQFLFVCRGESRPSAPEDGTFAYDVDTKTLLRYDAETRRWVQTDKMPGISAIRTTRP